MKSIPQRTLEYNIGLVKYENPKPRDTFNLTTVHSLLIDDHPKFIQLKSLIADYNKKQANSTVERPHLDRKFCERLYKMLCELVRICHAENQLNFLSSIYKWAFSDGRDDQFFPDVSNFNDKVRPTTASTKARPSTANTRKGTRPDSGVPTQTFKLSAQKAKQKPIPKQVMDKYPQVDFKQLKLGQKEFFQGHRTFHPEYQKPKTRLKHYHRKVLYNQPDEIEDFIQFQEQIQEQEPAKQPKLVQIPFQQQTIIKQDQIQAQKKQQQQNKQGVQGQAQGQGVEGLDAALGEEDVNIDDLVGDQQGLAPEQEEQVIDKLKPRLKAFMDEPKVLPRRDQQKLYDGLQKQRVQRNKLIKQVEEDQKMAQMMKQWAVVKGKVKVQQKRRSQSSRMMTRNTGILFPKKTTQTKTLEGVQVVDFSAAPVATTKSNVRPKTAFKPESQRVYQQEIKNAITVGKLSTHLPASKDEEGQVKKMTGNWIQQQKLRVCSVAQKPKKKTFQDILRNAQQQATVDTQNQIQHIKQKLTSNHISIGVNRIAKCLSHHDAELYDGEFVGQVTGQNMINNPFFKVAKKKKKKKKKK